MSEIYDARDLVEVKRHVDRLVRQRHAPAVHGYQALLLRSDVTLGELAHALRGSGIAISNIGGADQLVIHRLPAPDGAA